MGDPLDGFEVAADGGGGLDYAFIHGRGKWVRHEINLASSPAVVTSRLGSDPQGPFPDELDYPFDFEVGDAWRNDGIGNGPNLPMRYHDGLWWMFDASDGLLYHAANPGGTWASSNPFDDLDSDFTASYPDGPLDPPRHHAGSGSWWIIFSATDNTTSERGLFVATTTDPDSVAWSVARLSDAPAAGEDFDSWTTFIPGRAGVVGGGKPFATFRALYFDDLTSIANVRLFLLLADDPTDTFDRTEFFAYDQDSSTDPPTWPMIRGGVSGLGTFYERYMDLDNLRPGCRGEWYFDGQFDNSATLFVNTTSDMSGDWDPIARPSDYADTDRYIAYWPVAVDGQIVFGVYDNEADVDHVLAGTTTSSAQRVALGTRDAQSYLHSIDNAGDGEAIVLVYPNTAPYSPFYWLATVGGGGWGISL